MTIMTALTPTSIDITMGDGVVVTGNEVVLTTFEGYQGKVNMRRASTPRLNRAGDFTEQGTKGGKVISIRGEAVFNTPQEAAQFIIECESFLADGGVGMLNVNEVALGKTRSMEIELNTSEAPEVYGTTVGFGWDVYAADPAKYGEPDVFIAPIVAQPGQPIYETLAKNEVRVYNRTNAVASVMFNATSSWASPIITEEASGKQVKTPGLLVNTGNTFEYNGATNKLFKIDSAGTRTDYSGYLSAQWATIPANSSLVFKVTNDDATADSASNDVVVKINIIGQTEKFTATYNKVNGNPAYQSQNGVGPDTYTVGSLDVTNNGTVETGLTFKLVGEYENGFTIFDSLKGYAVVSVSGYLYGMGEGYEIEVNTNTGKITGPWQDYSQNIYGQTEWPVLKPGETRRFDLSYYSTSTLDKSLKAEVKTKWH